jgi:fluoride ion exporter CrcB/FEX
LCGGLTTFSAFAVQANEVGAANVRRGQMYVAATIIGSLLACVVGFQLFANA